MKNACPEPVGLEPTKRGEHGRAWSLDLAKHRQRYGVSPDDDASLAIWVIEAAWAHPLWHSYFLTLVHLRPMPDNRETIFYREGATHEFHLMALDPAHPREPLILAEDRPKLLTPANFAAQLIEPSDSAAISKLDGTVDLILSGELNPDTDAQRQWEGLFGNAMIKRGHRQT